MHRNTLMVLLAALGLVAPILIGCSLGPCSAPEEPGSGEGSESDQVVPASDVETLRMALLPVLDVLPFHVAEQNGYFDQAGVAVEFVPVKSPQERNTLMQTVQVDGMLTDLISPALFSQEEHTIKVVRTARQVYQEAPMFRILAAPGREARAPADLAGLPLGISGNSVIEYVTGRMPENAELNANQTTVQEVSARAVHFELLISGENPAACLPDPLASGALAAGAVPVVDDTSVPELSQPVPAFSTKALNSKPEAVRRLLQARAMAVDELNAHPDR